MPQQSSDKYDLCDRFFAIWWIKKQFGPPPAKLNWFNLAGVIEIRRKKNSKYWKVLVHSHEIDVNE